MNVPSRAGRSPCLTRSWFWVAGSPASPVRAQLGDEGVDVTLVDRNDYHQFQPLLYQVASSQLPAEDIARPHRTIFKEHTLRSRW